MKMPWFWPVVLAGLVCFSVLTLLFVYQQFPSSSAPSEQTAQSGPTECQTDADCIIAGCSATRCVPRDAASNTVDTCEFRDEYACFADDNCLCQNHLCRWENTMAFRACVDRVNGINCDALSGEDQARCEEERAADQRCDSMTGLEYINCRSSHSS